MLVKAMASFSAISLHEQFRLSLALSTSLYMRNEERKSQERQPDNELAIPYNEFSITHKDSSGILRRSHRRLTTVHIAVTNTDYSGARYISTRYLAIDRVSSF